ncbi:MAG: pseudouridine-5'-phosphate glycosidase, partial [Spirochaetaceae bacterium]|nr:pseudouridine-5'-phosphate glycosidase [Spirochaetaceae bacterium]
MDTLNSMNMLDITEELRDALASGKAAVALESTIITHGMPYPDNLECAETCEKRVREQGAVPATMAIIGGRLKAGLSREQLEYLASAKNAVKCSRRDLGYALSRGLDGGTTVAATMILSRLAGLRFFATGGLGGVHRGAESSMDISADMTELGVTPVCVVSAGVKSILDIGRSLEYLETLGVPVAAYGQDRFPAFYTPDSGFDAPLRLDSPAEAARML